MLNIASVAYRRLGEKESSMAAMTEALELAERVFGPYHPEVARCLHNLAVGHGDVGQHEEKVRSAPPATPRTHVRVPGCTAGARAGHQDQRVWVFSPRGGHHAGKPGAQLARMPGLALTGCRLWPWAAVDSPTA